MSNNSILQDYKDELQAANDMKAAGQVSVDAMTAGEELAKGRETVPINEYIEMWQNGITAMENGANPELFQY